MSIVCFIVVFSFLVMRWVSMFVLFFVVKGMIKVIGWVGVNGGVVWVSVCLGVVRRLVVVNVVVVRLVIMDCIIILLF